MGTIKEQLEKHLGETAVATAEKNYPWNSCRNSWKNSCVHGWQTSCGKVEKTTGGTAVGTAGKTAEGTATGMSEEVILKWVKKKL